MTEAQLRRNKNYWRDRTVRRMVRAERFLDIDSLPVYKRVEREILKDLNKIYKKGGFFEKLTKTEEKLHIDLLRKKLAKFDIQLEEVYSENQIRIINRLQALYQQNYWSIAQIAPEETRQIGNLLGNTYREAHYQASKDYVDVGVKGGLDILDNKVVEEVIKSDWSGKNFSDRIWENKRIFASEVPLIIGAGLATGESDVKIARRIREQFKVQNYEALRLVRTEGNYLYNQAELDANNIYERYEYYAVMDGRTCFVKDTRILTDSGYKKIQDIKINDKVLTQGGFKPVVATIQKEYSGNIYEIQSGRDVVYCTNNHPFYTKRGWIRADKLDTSDVLLKYNTNIFGKILRFFNKRLIDSYSGESVFKKKGILSFVSCFISMPVSSINFYTQSEFRQKKINRISTDPGFLNKFKFKLSKCFSYGSFKSGLSSIFSITRNGTKSNATFFTSTIDTATNNSLITDKAIDKLSLTEGTLLGAVRPFLAFRRIYKHLATSFTFHMKNLSSFAFHGAEVVPTNVANWDTKDSETIDTGLVDSFVNVSTLHGTINTSVLGKIIKRNIKLFSTRFTNFVLSCFGSTHINNNNGYNYITDSRILVYDLTIEDRHEYFAENILVHNSNICRSRNGRVFRKDEIKVGVNYPPLHPNCRSTAVWLLPDETSFNRTRPMKQTNLPYEQFDLDSLQHRDKILPDNDFITARPNKNSRDVYYFTPDTSKIEITEKLGEKWVSVFIKNDEGEIPKDSKTIRWEKAMKNQYDEKDIRGDKDWNAEMNMVGKLKGEALQKEVNRIMTSMPKDYASYDALKKVAKEFYGWQEK